MEEDSKKVRLPGWFLTPLFFVVVCSLSQSASAVNVTNQPVDEIRILMVGDVMLDRNVRELMNTRGAYYPFNKIGSLFQGNDIVFANLEGSITNNSSRTIGKINAPLVFTFSTTTAEVLAKTGFTVLGLANNHSLNFGNSGLVETKKYLTQNNLDYFGDPNNEKDLSIIKNVRGIKIGFIGYHQFSNKNYEKVLAEVKRICPTVRLCIVVPHWGVEYNKSFTKDQQTKAHNFIDAGADLVIGAHPHVVEPVEIYKNKAIFYSLGNFIFDLNFSYDTTHGLAVRITLSNKQVHYDLIPLSIIRSQVFIASAMAKERVLKSVRSREFTLVK